MERRYTLGSEAATSSTSTVQPSSSRPLATRLCDGPQWLKRLPSLQEQDVIILLTPVVMPISQDPDDHSDPFEPLGRALAARHDKVRQIPYTQGNGITSTHIGFIKRGTVIILCLTIRPDHPLRLDVADLTMAVSDNKPCIMVVCTTQTSKIVVPFPTVIQTFGYTPRALEATVALMFGREQQKDGAASANGNHQFKSWPVQEWNASADISSVWDLWTLNISGISGSFSLDVPTLAALLCRPGCNKHYTVRDPRSQEVVGFCATYISQMDQEGKKSLASLAFLLVRATYQYQGIGLSLYTHAMDQLSQTRGITRIQLGTTFPRIIYGPIQGMDTIHTWLRNRGWEIDGETPGQGRAVFDLIKTIDQNSTLPEDANTQPAIRYRPCSKKDIGEVLALVNQGSRRSERMGWYNQYTSLMDDINMKDIILELEDDRILAAAITYTPLSGNAVSLDLPWAGRIGHDVGGITCISNNEFESDKHARLSIGIVDACIKTLVEQGMKKVFLDAITDEVQEFKSLGFSEWARYREVWKNI